MKSFSSALILGATGLAILSTAACGDDTENSSTGGGGGGTPTSSASTATSSPTSSSGSSSDGGGTPSSSSSSSNGGAGPGPTSTGSGGDGAGGTGPVGEFDCSAPSGDLPALATQDVVTVSGVPLQMRQAPGDNNTIYVGTQDGRIVIVRDGAELPTPFLDISDRVRSGGEEGFLGFAFHPDYATNGRFFVNYTADEGGGETYVAEYTVSEDPDLANTTEVGRVIEAPAYEGNHNGGAIEFGADGALWVSVGDGGGSNDQQCLAHDLDARAGKILRANISTPGTYSAAEGNFPGADEYVFDVGVRNVWRMSFDVCTDDLWLADVGQGAWEEVNVQAPDDGPQDFGWSAREGAHGFNSGCPALPGPYAEPILDYDHGEGNSITGGYVYRGSAIPALRGAYIFGDFGSGTVWSTRYAPGDATPVQKSALAGLAQGGGGLVSFGQDNRGEVYILLGGGAIRRIVAAE